MKIILQILVCTVGLVFGTQHAAFAQKLKPISIGVYGEMGFPTGDFEKSHSGGFGGGLQTTIQLPFVGLGVTGSLGYMNFPAKAGNAAAAVPLRAGIKYSMAAFYIKAQGGLAWFVDAQGNQKSTAFIVSPAIGVQLGKFDLEGKYEVWAQNQSLAFWGLKAGINFF